MYRFLCVVATLLLSSMVFAKDIVGQFDLNITNVNALIGLACAGSENATSTGYLERDGLMMHFWRTTEDLGDYSVEGYCNGSVVGVDGSFEIVDERVVEFFFSGDELNPELEPSSNVVTVIGRVGKDSIEIIFSRSAINQGHRITSVIKVESLSVKKGAATYADSWVSSVLPPAANRALGDLISRNSTMYFGNFINRSTGKGAWNSANPENKLSVRAHGANWLMNFGSEENQGNLFVNTGLVIKHGGPYRVRSFNCGGESCGSSVLLDAGERSILGCSSFSEDGSSAMTAAECQGLLSQVAEIK